MNVHLLDGTYELFRHYYALPESKNPAGEEVAATRGVIGSVLAMLEEGVTHVAVATDHVIDSFRNALWAGYKTGEGIEPDLWAQFHPLERALSALGVVVWPMVEFEADDALAAGAARAAADTRVDRVFICTPDKDLAQAVVGERVVQFDRRQRTVIGARGVRDKFGVGPASIPDYLALVGDSADGYPGIKGWGKKSASTLLARYERLDNIPDDPAAWDVEVRGKDRLASSLTEHREQALLFRRLATLRVDVPLQESIDDLRWRGPTAAFRDTCQRLGAEMLFHRAERSAPRGDR